MTRKEKFVNFWKEKFVPFWKRHNLQYLVLAAIVYGVDAILYFIAEFLPLPTIELHMKIDEMIPLISYFQFFYLSYYIVPPIFMWRLSFYDKKKLQAMTMAAFTTTLICFICYLSCQIHMYRPEAEAEIAKYTDFSSVHDLESFFKWTLVIQYAADPKAVNCLPSLHAVYGAVLIVIGTKFFKSDERFPLYQRIICWVFGAGIVMSTFFVKQHYFIDAIVGMFLYILVYIVWQLIVNHFLKKKNVVIVNKYNQEKQS